jgi:hypothetical protein
MKTNDVLTLKVKSLELRYEMAKMLGFSVLLTT